MFVCVATLIAAAVGAAAIFPFTGHADVGLMTGSGAGGLTVSSGPYDDCPPGTYRAKGGDCVERPDSNRGGATGQCCDGTDTHSERRTGACSRHDGVCQWFAAAGNPANRPSVASGTKTLPLPVKREIAAHSPPPTGQLPGHSYIASGQKCHSACFTIPRAWSNVLPDVS
jgi:Protein of unknown function (DUF3761)